MVFDRSPKVVEELVKEKAVGSSSLQGLVKMLDKPRAFWLMVPTGCTSGDTRSSRKKPRLNEMQGPRPS